MKITDYRISTGEAEVKASLDQGYQPHGDPFLKYDGGSIYTLVQAMIKTDTIVKNPIKGYVAVEGITSVRNFLQSELELYGNPLYKGSSMIQVMVHRQDDPLKSLPPKPNNLDSGNKF